MSNLASPSFSLKQRASGVLLHPSSLPGPHGCGDFGPAAYAFVDWLHDAGQRWWQWLPTTPIGPGNSPYQSVSAFAGNPLFVALEPMVERGWLRQPDAPGFDAHQVEFGRVVAWREQQLRWAYAGFLHHASAAEKLSFEGWSARQGPWLADTALFLAIERQQGGRPWWAWPVGLRDRERAALQQAQDELLDEVDFQRWVQWCFDMQCTSLKAYANARGVGILGDLPIFIAHHSVDVWTDRESYELDADGQPVVVAGVPPDDLGPLGQRWGNPMYRWPRMAKDGWRWWSARVRRMLHQADAFRIDHFRGFAGYFEIPSSSPDARTGDWRRGPGRALFDAITRDLGPLEIIAEDLGLITPDVGELREALGYPGMKILQFAFGGDGRHEFLPHEYPRDTVVYTGTHDNDTVQGWWAAAKPDEQHFAGTYLACGPVDVHWAMIRAAHNSVADLSIVPLQDVLGLGSQHRMNTPGTLSDANWAWRFTWDMVGSEPGRVLGMVTAASGRGPFARLGLGERAARPPQLAYDPAALAAAPLQRG